MAGILLNTLQQTGQPSPTTKNYLAQKINSAKVDNPCSRAKYNQVFHLLGHVGFQAIYTTSFKNTYKSLLLYLMTAGKK